MPWIPGCVIADRAAIFSNHDAFLEHKVLALPLRIGAYACGRGLAGQPRRHPAIRKGHVMSKRENDANNIFRPSDSPLTEYESKSRCAKIWNG
jgi:hypothetical protein